MPDNEDNNKPISLSQVFFEEGEVPKLFSEVHEVVNGQGAL